MENWQFFAVVAAVVAAALLIVFRPLRTAAREARFAAARRCFHAQRERLEAKFVYLAAAHAKLGSPLWEECDFDDDVAYVRNRSSGEVSAFVAVVVAVNEYETPSNDLDGSSGDFRSATAVFHFSGHHWETDGRAFLNLNPAEAIRFYQNDLEMIEQELAHRS